MPDDPNIVPHIARGAACDVLDTDVDSSDCGSCSASDGSSNRDISSGKSSSGEGDSRSLYCRDFHLAGCLQGPPSQGPDLSVGSLEQWGGNRRDVIDIKVLQRHKVLSALVRRCGMDSPGDWPRNLMKYRRYRNQLRVVDGILLFGEPECAVPVVPFQFMVEVTMMVHHRQGHPGRQKLIDTAGSLFWHPSLSSIAADVCRTCDMCQRVKVAGIAQPPVVKIQTSSPFELLSVDLVSLPRTRSGNVCCLVTVDHYSKWLSVVPLPNKTTATVTGAMRARVFPSLTRVPDKLLSDNGPEFKSGVFGELMEEYSVQHVFTTAYKPSSNGLVERMNRTLLEKLRSVGATSQDWDQYVPQVVVRYNHTLHSELQMSPSAHLLKRPHPLYPAAPIPRRDSSFWKEGNPSFKSFKRGALVMRKVVFKGRNVVDKLSDRWDGPYRVIVQNRNQITYVIQNLDSNKEYRVHHLSLIHI